MSDERVLGVLPDDTAPVLLDWALARLDDLAAHAPDIASFDASAEALRQEMRVAADAAAARGDDAATLAANLGVSTDRRAEAARHDPHPLPEPAPVWDEQPPCAPSDQTEAEASATSGVEPEVVGPEAIAREDPSAASPDQPADSPPLETEEPAIEGLIHEIGARFRDLFQRREEQE